MVGVVAGLAMPFVYTPATTFPFVFGKGIYFCILVEAMVALYAVLAVVSPEDRPRRSPLLYVVLAYAAALLVSTALGFDPHRSFWGNHERMSGSFVILHFIAYFVIARSVIRTKRGWDWILGIFLASSVVMGCLAVVEHTRGLFVDQPGGRVWATLGNYIYLGVYMLFAMFTAAYLATEAKSWWTRGILAAVGLFSLYIIFLTETRAAILAVLLSVLVIPFLTAWRAKGKVRRWTVVAAAAIVALGAGAYLARDTAFVQAIPGVRRLVNTTLTGGGDRTRIIAWEIAIQAWKDKPIFGWGPENFYAAFNVYYHPESLIYSYYETWFDRAHNSVLDMLSMTGVVGTVLALGIYLVAAYTAIRRVRAGGLTAVQGALFVLFLGAYFFQNLFAFDALSGFLLFYLLLAFLDAEPKIQAPAPEESKRLPTAAAAIVTAPIVILMVWCAVLNVRMWQANVLNLKAIAQIRYGRLADALTLHEAALAEGSPHASELRADFAREAAQVIGNVPKGQENDAPPLLQKAVDDLRANVAEGKDVFDSIMLAQVLMSSNSPDLLSEAERVLKDAIPLSPKRQQLLYTLARVLILENRPDEAITIMDQVITDEPAVGESHWVFSLALNAAGKKDEAWNELVQAMKYGYVWRSDSERQMMLDMSGEYGAPQDPKALAAYAEAEAATGASSSAVADMKKAVGEDPTLQDRYDALLTSLGFATSSANP